MLTQSFSIYFYRIKYILIHQISQTFMAHICFVDNKTAQNLEMELETWVLIFFVETFLRSFKDNQMLFETFLLYWENID